MPKNRFYSSLLGSFKHGERQTDRDSTSKFFQYGWRCTTNEDDYSNKTLIGNWNEERYDIQKIVQPKPLPSQDLDENLTGFQATSLNWNLLQINQLHSPAT
ncbi:UPF0686 protein C11orf1 homolog [Aythya fuligula]|uniref:UPF0686 protein C11orf1 homolog n=1 Tax=Aythya fuligula TaxID=219594 RepID=A0A6J3E2Q9_AYTFU|nr:UPF0686 protein C11orf1 homolog [Aythya fuligula]